MRPMLRFPRFTAVLLLAAASCAGAETPLPDPVAPAVIGRPLDQIRPARPLRQKQAVAKPGRAAQATARMGAAPATASTPLTFAPAAVPEPGATHRAAKQAVDDRADPNARLPDNVGKGTHFARKPLGAGAYFGSRHQQLVRQYYEAHPVPGRPASWKIGEPVPPTAALTGVPDALRATLPRVPPGYQYVQLGGEVLLVAQQSRMVVDGVSRGLR